MNPDEIDTLYQYKTPFIGKCDHCGETDITIFFETPNGAQLCNNCTKQIFDTLRERGLGFEVIEELENDPDRNTPAGDAEASETGLQDIVTKIVPAQYRGQMNPTIVQFEYEQINWEAVDETDTIGDDHLVAWGGRPGAYEEVSALEFEAVQAYFDSSLTDANVVFLTDDGPYVYEFVSDQVDEETLAGEVLRVLANRSRAGIIDGLQPKEETGPPIDGLYEHLEFHDDIEAFDITQRDEELVCEVVLRQNRNSESVLQEVRMVDGIQYPKPDVVEIVEELE